MKLAVLFSIITAICSTLKVARERIERSMYGVAGSGEKTAKLQDYRTLTIHSERPAEAMLLISQEISPPSSIAKHIFYVPYSRTSTK
jgi:hypothetical protein